MITLLALFCLWNFIGMLLIVNRLGKINRHHHGGFTAGSELKFKE